MKSLLRLVAVTALVLALSAPAGAADTGWTIDAFGAEITVRPDGSLAILEAIDVDFGGLVKHGILRDIPTRYRYDDAHDRRYRLAVQSVTDEGGRAIPYQVTAGDAITEIRIGDPNRTVSGRQTYRIRYTVAGALNRFADHDELYWNVNGDQWGVPTLIASASVIAPAGAIQKVTCFQGPTGSTEPCRASDTPDRAAFVATRPLAPGEQLTIVTALRPGAVAVAPPVLTSRPRTFSGYFSTAPAALGAAATVLIVGLWLVWRLWWTQGRDRGRARGAIVAEYEPPGKLRPAQLGVLVDERADPRDLVATIVDLAVRGYLVITELPKQGLFGHADWMLDKRKPGDDLLPYERRLFEGLFTDGDSVLLSSLKGTFQPTLVAAEKLLYRDATERGWFVADPARVRTAYAGLGCVTAGVGIGLVFLLGQLLGWGLVGLAVVPAGIGLLVLNRAMPARTAAGAALYAQALGFKRYMDTAETDRAAFAEKEGLFTVYLPYAVMFASVDRWTRAFAGLDTAQAVSSFYVGSGPFNALAFSTSFSGFSGSLASTVVATPAGSGASGFSGGGFSGGGGGGGGGGSW
ncbi:MAG TPA: DUF2207 domain-containing protein [Candidatus Limnocylindria bacterium]|nr:DUF2207 domain-containing protein [Candidatus Limnocylindria bacterium]